MSAGIERRALCGALGAAIVAPRARAASAWRLATGYRSESFHTVKLPIAGADSVPFITGSYADARRLWRLQRPLIERQFAARGLQPLYAVPWQPQGLYAVRPITGMADLAGRRMRTYNPTTERIAALVGAKAVDVTVVDVGKALAQGRIDSMITSAVTGVENQVGSGLHFHCEIDAWFPKNLVFANAQSMKTLSPGARRACAGGRRGQDARLGRERDGVPRLGRRTVPQRHQDRARAARGRQHTETLRRAALARMGPPGRCRSERHLHALLHPRLDAGREACLADRAQAH